MSGIGKIQYIKISRTDGNGTDITDALESLESIVMPLSTGNKEFNILNRTRENEYFLFYVSMAGTEDIPGADKSSPNYSFSGSYSGFINNFRSTPPITASVDNRNFFLEGGGGTGLGGGLVPIDSYRIMTLPAKNICVTVSSSFNFAITDGKSPTTSVTASIRILTNPLTPGIDPPSPNIIAESVITQSAQDLDTTNMFFTGSYELSAVISASGYTPGDCLYFDLHVNAPGSSATFSNVTFNNGIFQISSSNAVVNPLDISVEPYFTSPFYGTDCDVMYGDISRGVLNPFLQDIDYSTDINRPVNYLAIQNNTATNASVPESMFTMGSLINPSYNSLNTTARFNVDDSLSSQVTGGTFVAYAPALGTQDSGGGKYLTVAVIQYLISPSEEIFEIGSSEENLKLLEMAFATFANPLTDSSGNVVNDSFYGNPNDPINTNIILTSGSLPTPSTNPSGNSFSEYNGYSFVYNFLGANVLIIPHTGSAPGPITTFQDGGGIIYPASIGLTSAKDLPSKALQILSNNRLI